MKPPQREGDELRLLQLQVRVVIDAVRRKREHDPREHRGAEAAGQATRQQRDADAGDRETGKEDGIVDHDRADPGPLQRRGERAGDDERLRVGERVALRVEDVRVEEVARSARQLVRHPRQHPRDHERIARIVDAVLHAKHLRVGHHRRQCAEEDERERDESLRAHDLGSTCRMSSSSFRSSMELVAA